MIDRSAASHAPRGSAAALTIAAAGIVYGDIGTSPLYALDQIFLGHGGVPLSHENVLGGISLVIWTITVIVAIKYAIFVLRAENDGEGGVFALYGLLHGYKQTWDDDIPLVADARGGAAVWRRCDHAGDQRARPPSRDLASQHRALGRCRDPADGSSCSPRSLPCSSRARPASAGYLVRF